MYMLPNLGDADDFFNSGEDEAEKFEERMRAEQQASSDVYNASTAIVEIRRAQAAYAVRDYNATLRRFNSFQSRLKAMRADAKKREAELRALRVKLKTTKRPQLAALQKQIAAKAAALTRIRNRIKMVEKAAAGLDAQLRQLQARVESARKATPAGGGGGGSAPDAQTPRKPTAAAPSTGSLIVPLGLLALLFA